MPILLAFKSFFLVAAAFAGSPGIPKAAPSVTSTGSRGLSMAKVLMVDLDDVGFDLLATSTTPTLDYMRSNGRFFSSFVTAPSCTPTRVMLQMGAYPSHPDILIGENTSVDSTMMPLSPLVPLARHLTNYGRSTAKVGKWHLSTQTDLDHPRAAGYQSFRGAIGNLRTQFDTYYDYRKVIDGQPVQVTGRHLTTDETDDAIRFVGMGIDFISVSYHAPHAPWHVPPSHLHSVSPVGTDLFRARAMLQACDAEFGRLLREALQAGYVVIVFGDNGTAGPIGGLKGTPKEGGIHVPMWVMGPGVQPGDEPALVSAVDLYATASDLLGVPQGGCECGPSSRSFAGLLRNGGAPIRRWVYSERFKGNGLPPGGNGRLWIRAVRGDQYKLTRGEGSGADRLYDFVMDSTEFMSLLDFPPLVPSALLALRAYREVMGRL